jgi:hypothetical protein
MEEHSGRAICFYDDDENGIGRAWIMPVKNGHVIFNAYGVHLTSAARVFAQHTQTSYKKIHLDNQGSTVGLLWINSGAGFFIGEVSEHEFNDCIDLDICTTDRCWCGCRDIVHSDDERCYCSSCVSEDYTCCEDCGEYVSNDDINNAADRSVCDSCLENYTSCSHCGDYTEETTETENGDVCDYCLRNHYTLCEDCDTYVRNTHTTENGEVCESCYDDYSCCEVCNEMVRNLNTTQDGEVCDGCYEDYSECEDCGEYTRKPNSVSGGCEVCNDCFLYYEKCPECGEWVKGDCPDCIDETVCVVSAD